MQKINRHADDFGLSRSSSKVIYRLCKSNKLDSFSLMVNLSTVGEFVNEIREMNQLGKKISIHLNFTEGKCVADSSLLKDLVDKNGFFSKSWESYFIDNYNFMKRKKIKNQLKIEIINQINKGIEFIGSDDIYIDSHQHIHMIPVVFDALTEVISENKLKVKYIRVSKEPLLPFLSGKVNVFSFPFINFIKNFILNVYSRRVEKVTTNMNLAPMYIWGLIMSGKMDLERIHKLQPQVENLCEKKHRELEMIFHPGKMDKSEVTSEIKRNSDISFYLSKNREIEQKALENL